MGCVHWRGRSYFFPLFSRRHFRSRGVLQFAPPWCLVFTPTVAFPCHCPYSSLGFLPVSSSFSLYRFCTASPRVVLAMFLLSFAVCTHQHPILIPHSPHITFCLCPSFSTRWMPELKPQAHGLQHFLHRQEKKSVFLHSESFALLLCIPEHSRAWSWLFSPLSTLLISTSQQFLDSSYS